MIFSFSELNKIVSTHSRLKAAGFLIVQLADLIRRFNTQPPEGGWVMYGRCMVFGTCFNTQPPEGGWMPLLAGLIPLLGFNTQPPEGGWGRNQCYVYCVFCFNTQPPEGGWFIYDD